MQEVAAGSEGRFSSSEDGAADRRRQIMPSRLSCSVGRDPRIRFKCSVYTVDLKSYSTVVRSMTAQEPASRFPMPDLSAGLVAWLAEILTGVPAGGAVSSKAWTRPGRSRFRPRAIRIALTGSVPVARELRQLIADLRCRSPWQTFWAADPGDVVSGASGAYVRSSGTDLFRFPPWSWCRRASHRLSSTVGPRGRRWSRWGPGQGPQFRSLVQWAREADRGVGLGAPGARPAQAFPWQAHRVPQS